TLDTCGKRFSGYCKRFAEASTTERNQAFRCESSLVCLLAYGYVWCRSPARSCHDHAHDFYNLGFLAITIKLLVVPVEGVDCRCEIRRVEWKICGEFNFAVVVLTQVADLKALLYFRAPSETLSPQSRNTSLAQRLQRLVQSRHGIDGVT